MSQTFQSPIESPIEHQQQAVRQLKLIWRTLERMYKDQVKFHSQLHKEISEQVARLSLQLESLRHIPRGSTLDPSEKTLDRLLAYLGTCHGQSLKDSSTTPVSSTDPANETFHLLTKELAQFLTKDRPLLSRLAASLPVHLLEEWQQLIRFASRADEPQDSS